jgi:hypothetical protein
MSRSHNTPRYANQIIDNLIKAAEICDPVAINEFFLLTIESNMEHLDVINGTISIEESAKRQHAIAQGSILLSLFNHFASKKISERFGMYGVSSD